MGAVVVVVVVVVVVLLKEQKRWCFQILSLNTSPVRYSIRQLLLYGVPYRGSIQTLTADQNLKMPLLLFFKQNNKQILILYLLLYCTQN